jgi:hypothetical protein
LQSVWAPPCPAKGFEAGGTIVRVVLAGLCDEAHIRTSSELSSDGKRERHRTMTVIEIAQPV